MLGNARVWASFLAMTTSSQEMEGGNASDRHDITSKNIVGEAASIDNQSFQKCKDKNLERILGTSADKDIYDADETELVFLVLPVKTLVAKTDKCVGGKNSKNCITVLICTNMGGLDKRNLLVIGKVKKPQGFAKVLSMPVAFRNTGYLQQAAPRFYKGRGKTKCKVLLLLDNCSTHHINAHLSAVEVPFLPPNMTTKLHLMDHNVIANFKVHIRRRVIEHLLNDIRTADNPASLKTPLVNVADRPRHHKHGGACCLFFPFPLPLTWLLYKVQAVQE